MKTDMHAYVRGERRKVPDSLDGWFDPRKTAIVEIDMQRSCLGDPPDVFLPLPQARPKIQVHNEFNEAARKLGVRVIHVGTVFSADGIDGLGWPVMELLPFVLGPRYSPKVQYHAREGSKSTDFMVDVKEGDYIIKGKKRYDCFYQTNLELLLKALGVDTVVITGITTEACCLCTSYEAMIRDYKVLMPQDVVEAWVPQGHQAALYLIGAHVGLVVNWQELVAEWTARVETPAKVT